MLFDDWRREGGGDIFSERSLDSYSDVAMKRFWSGLPMAKVAEDDYWKDFRSNIALCYDHDDDYECCRVCLYLNYNRPLGRIMWERGFYLYPKAFKIAEEIEMDPAISYDFVQKCSRCSQAICCKGFCDMCYVIETAFDIRKLIMREIQI